MLYLSFLGESASSVNSHCKSTSELEKSFQSDGVPVKGREFYDKLLVWDCKDVEPLSIEPLKSNYKNI